MFHLLQLRPLCLDHQWKARTIEGSHLRQDKLYRSPTTHDEKPMTNHHQLALLSRTFAEVEDVQAR